MKNNLQCHGILTETAADMKLAVKGEPKSNWLTPVVG
jgi:hypothetical protein